MQETRKPINKRPKKLDLSRTDKTENFGMKQLISQNNLKIMNSDADRFDLFEAISFYAYRSTKAAVKLRSMCISYLQLAYKNNNFPFELTWLRDCKELLSIYMHKQDHHYFEGVD